jgi:hypothetical protein
LPSLGDVELDLVAFLEAAGTAGTQRNYPATKNCTLPVGST